MDAVLTILVCLSCRFPPSERAVVVQVQVNEEACQPVFARLLKPVGVEITVNCAADFRRRDHGDRTYRQIKAVHLRRVITAGHANEEIARRGEYDVRKDFVFTGPRVIGVGDDISVGV